MTLRKKYCRYLNIAEYCRYLGRPLHIEIEYMNLSTHINSQYEEGARDVNNI